MKKIIVASLILMSVLIASQADAANFFDKIFKRNATSTPVARGNVWDSNCIVKAIDKREAAIGVVYGEMTGKISTALTARAKALSDSWAQADRSVRLSSRNTAWKMFNDTAKNARNVYKTSVHGIWASYKADAATCRMDVDGVESEDREVDL
jgi:hypothetical protein